jgi:ATP-dependent RNA helicase DDX27
MANGDFIMTIESDEEDISIAQPKAKAGKASSSKSSEDAPLNPEFVFDLSGDAYDSIVGYQSDLRDLVKTGSKPVRPS